MDPSSRRLRLMTGTALALLLGSCFVRPSPLRAGGQKKADVPRLLGQIRDEVLGLDRYPGEDFARGEFFLGEGDDDTCKTHAVGILVNAEAEGSRMTIVVSRLEPARDNPRIKYARESRTVVCRFSPSLTELVRSDYPETELEKLLPLVLRAVIDKKALLKKEASCDP